MTDLAKQVEDDFKEAMSEQGVEALDISMGELADIVEKACKNSTPFSNKIYRNMRETSDISSTIRIAAGCHPMSGLHVIYRNGFVYLACAKCSGPVAHLKIGD